MAKDTGTGTSITCSIAPMLSVRHGARAVEFYKSAFGAIEVFRVEDPSGAVVSRLSVDGAEFWVSDESPQHANFSPESLGGGSVRMILTVPDPDAMFAKALAAGARQVVAVEENYG
jgi:PhnB protein